MTTGLSEEIFEQLYALSEKVPVLYSLNFSLGIALCFEVAEFLKKRLKERANISIEEIHHTQKVDAPSGTAKRLAKILGVEEIVSRREGTAVGMHKVDFLLATEKISLSHEALSSEVFAEGALLATKFLWNQPPKFYSMQDVFG